MLFADELLAKTIMADRRRKAEQYRQAHPSRRHVAQVRPVGGPAQAGPRDTRPRRRLRPRRANARRP